DRGGGRPRGAGAHAVLELGARSAHGVSVALTPPVPDHPSRPCPTTPPDRARPPDSCRLCELSAHAPFTSHIRHFPGGGPRDGWAWWRAARRAGDAGARKSPSPRCVIAGEGLISVRARRDSNPQPSDP